MPVTVVVTSPAVQEYPAGGQLPSFVIAALTGPAIKRNSRTTVHTKSNFLMLATPPIGFETSISNSPAQVRTGDGGSLAMGTPAKQELSHVVLKHSVKQVECRIYMKFEFC
jgi:hypothetical protein